MFDRDPASRGLGMELLEAGDGRARVRMTVTAAMVNGHAIAHGGYVFLLADTAFACACNSHGPVTGRPGRTFLPAAVRRGEVRSATASERARTANGIYAHRAPGRRRRVADSAAAAYLARTPRGTAENRSRSAGRGTTGRGADRPRADC